MNTRIASLLPVPFGLLLVLFGAPQAAWAGAEATTTTIAVTAAGSVVTTVASGTVVTLTATVNSGTAKVTIGQVNFCDASVTYCTDIHLLGTAQLTSAGTAVLRLRPAVGSHSYKAVFGGTNSLAGSKSSASTLSVTGKTSTAATITQSGNPGSYTLTATVGAAGAAAPTGSVSFLDTSFSNALLGTVTLGSGTPGPNFLNTSNPNSGNSPVAVATGDFNNDGIPDLASANSTDGTVTILLGNGDGTFVAATGSPITVGTSPVSLAVGDVNGDGDADLAVASSSGSLTVLIGKGDGTFSQAAGSPIVLATNLYSLVFADFNGDGLPDLAVLGQSATTYNASSLYILTGNGSGSFAITSGSPVTLSTSPTMLLVADFNNDGRADLAVGGIYSLPLVVLLGNGDGTFTQATSNPISFEGASGIVAADFNQDGIMDVAVSNQDPGDVSIYLGDGKGGFTETPASPITVYGYLYSITVGDFNGDGLVDIATGSYITSVLVGQGNGTFTLAQGSSETRGTQIAAADFNGDGLSDLVLAYDSYATLAILLSENSMATATATNIAPVGAGSHQVVASYPGTTEYRSSTSSPTALTAMVLAPVISPAQGTFTAAQSITITDASPGATIYYQLSGAMFTHGYVEYTGPIPMEGSGTLYIEAYASETGWQQSSNVFTTVTFNFPTAAAIPKLSLASGSYATAQTLTITDTTPGASIFYSTNGEYSSSYSTPYTGPITVSNSEVVTAIALAPGYSQSANASAQYDIDSSTSRFIYTIAGNQTPGYTGDGGPATFAQMNVGQGVAVDSNGSVYFSDYDNVVRKVAAGSGIVTTIAGTGVSGHTGDNGLATNAELWFPTALAVDGAGNVFIAETGDSVVRRVDATTGNITTFVGATGLVLDGITGLACDHLGNLFIAEKNAALEIYAASGNTRGIAGYPATIGPYQPINPNGIAVDSEENVYISSYDPSEVYEYSAQGTVTVFAGDGNPGFSGDGGLATAAELFDPRGLAIDGSGNLYITDSGDYAVREVNPSGVITTVAGVLGDDAYSLGGDGNPAINETLPYLSAIAADSAGNLYLADQWSYRIRKVTVPTTPPTAAAATPVFSLTGTSYSTPQTLTMTAATPGAEIYVTLDGSTPTTINQGYHGPININGTVTVQAIALAPGYLPSAPVSATYTITTPPTAVISTVAGNGFFPYALVSGPALTTAIGAPQAIALDGSGNMYFADPEDNIVWELAASTGDVSIVAGTGAVGDGSPGGLATATALREPEGIAVDKAGNLYIADSLNERILMVSAQTGMTSLIAGPGVPGTLGDGGLATSAYVGVVYGMCFDSAGNLYLAGVDTGTIRMITANSGMISTVAGGGSPGQLGDGGLATAAYLSSPVDVTADSSGNLYISDEGNERIRKVNASTREISTIAGDGTSNDTGDGGPATSAGVWVQQGIAVDKAGNVYISTALDTVREIEAATGNINTVAGEGYFGFSGDGGSAAAAELDIPEGLVFDAAGNLYIADAENARVRKMTFPAPLAQTITFTPPASVYYGIPALTLSATGGASGNPVTFSIVSGPGSLSGANNSVLTISGIGTVVIAANQAGATGYAAAAQVTANISVVSPVAAALTSPTRGTVLAGSSVNFTWGGAPDPTGYYLWIGSTGVGSNNIYNSAEKTVTNYTFTAMPTNGETVYVRLITNFNGSWVHNDYTFTAAREGAPILSPVQGSTFAGSSIAFTWKAMPSATGYYLWIGSTGAGSNNIYNSAEKTVTSYTFPYMPTNGETIYVRLITNYSGSWVSNDYTYTSSAPAVITAPAQGATLAGPSVTFNWTVAPSAAGYYLWIGSTGVGSNNIYNSAAKTGTSYTFTQMPVNGETIYVRLNTNYNGVWLHNDYTYTAATPAALTSPAAGSTLPGASVTFNWTAAANATGYYLWIGSTGAGSNNLYNSAEKIGTSYTYPYMPTNGETIYVRLSTNYNGIWVHEDYTFKAAP